MLRVPHRSFVLAVGVLLAGAACAGDPAVAPVVPGQATLLVTADLSGTQVATVVVDVTASDIPTTLVFNIPIINGTASGTITVPAGSNRTIMIRGYDAGGVVTHSGSLTLNIQPGTNAAMGVVLTPLTGDLPINATLGSFVVDVTPSTASLHLSGTTTVQLSATITDTQGQVVAGTVAWATHDPGIAIVDGAGLVTAVGTGSTTISAVFKGVTDVATITVTP